MLICSTCGTELPDGTCFCYNCGSPVTADTPAEMQPDKPELIAPEEVAVPDVETSMDFGGSDTSFSTGESPVSAEAVPTETSYPQPDAVQSPIAPQPTQPSGYDPYYGQPMQNPNEYPQQSYDPMGYPQGEQSYSQSGYPQQGYPQGDYNQGYQQPYQQPYPSYSQPQAQKPRTTNGKSIASLILGIISLLSSCTGSGVVFGIIGIVFAVLARKDFQREEQAFGAPQNGGKGIATGGLICSILGIIISVILIMASLIVAVVSYE